MELSTLIFIFLFLLGLCVGSFLNVLIYRLPKEEEFVRTPSHCMSCGHELKWYELFPVFSWLAQGGKCRACGVKLSAQYPIVEALNGTMWLLTAILYQGDWLTVGLYCALFSLLLVITVIDWRTFTIPNGINLAIFVLGMEHIAREYTEAGQTVLALTAALGFAVWLLFDKVLLRFTLLYRHKWRKRLLRV